VDSRWALRRRGPIPTAQLYQGTARAAAAPFGIGINSQPSHANQMLYNIKLSQKLTINLWQSQFFDDCFGLL